jgi:hypothetical protein
VGGDRMLQAIINGKAGTLTAEVKPGDSWRRVFRSSEDLLTASVFERLAYLEGALVWEILGRTFRPALLPPRKLAELEEIRFWPNWPDTDGAVGQDIQPDVFMTFAVGDPTRRVALIIECKRGNNHQTAGQWAREWVAFQAQNISAEPPDEVILLALGGLPESATATVARFVDEIRKDWGQEVRAAAADWPDLSRALDEVELGGGIAERVVDDIRAALELDGYRTIRPMSELALYAARYPISSTSAVTLRMSSSDRRFSAMGELAAWAASHRTKLLSGSVLAAFRSKI